MSVQSPCLWYQVWNCQEAQKCETDSTSTHLHQAFSPWGVFTKWRLNCSVSSAISEDETREGGQKKGRRRKRWRVAS